MQLGDVSESGAFHVVTEPDFAAVFMLGAEDRADTVENVDAQLRLPDGTRWSASFMTLGAISAVMDRWRETGECLNGAFFQVHDLVIVPERGVNAMVQAFRGILSEGGPQGVLPPLDPLEEPEPGNTVSE
jgi:hypothetical protein